MDTSQLIELNPSDTHHVAALGYIVRDGKILILKRVFPPKVWAAPGGSLHHNENPLEGVKREIMEETGFTVYPCFPFSYWMGEHKKRTVLVLEILCVNPQGEFEMCGEHTEAMWATIEDIKKLSDQKSLFNSFQTYERAIKLAELYPGST